MKIYTDGATSGNGYENAAGGWAYIIVDHNEQIIFKACGHVENATNNICEMMAVIEACTEAAKIPGGFTVYSDSAYIVNCCKDRWYKKWQMNGWVNSKGQTVANRFLWEALIPFFESPQFTFEKIKGHAGNHFNEIVDRMAVDAKLVGGTN